MLLLYDYREKKVVLRVMNHALMKVSLLPCGLNRTVFFLFRSISFKFILILSSHLCLVLSRSVLCYRFTYNMFKILHSDLLKKQT